MNLIFLTATKAILTYSLWNSVSDIQIKIVVRARLAVETLRRKILVEHSRTPMTQLRWAIKTIFWQTFLLKFQNYDKTPSTSSFSNICEVFSSRNLHILKLILRFQRAPGNYRHMNFTNRFSWIFSLVSKCFSKHGVQEFSFAKQNKI